MKKVSFEPDSVTVAVSEPVEARHKITHKVKRFLTSGIQNVWCFAHSMCCKVGEYIFIRSFLKPISKGFTPDFRAENMVSFKEVYPWNELERYVLCNTIILKDEKKLFTREFLEL